MSIANAIRSVLRQVVFTNRTEADLRVRISNIINDAKVFGKMLSCMAWSFQ